jgi:hypothetical protein
MFNLKVQSFLSKIHFFSKIIKSLQKRDVVVIKRERRIQGGYIFSILIARNSYLDNSELVIKDIQSNKNTIKIIYGNTTSESTRSFSYKDIKYNYIAFYIETSAEYIDIENEQGIKILEYEDVGDFRKW